MGFIKTFIEKGKIPYFPGKVQMKEEKKRL
jgi:hypothetical protein